MEGEVTAQNLWLESAKQKRNEFKRCSSRKLRFDLGQIFKPASTQCWNSLAGKGDAASEQNDQLQTDKTREPTCSQNGWWLSSEGQQQITVKVRVWLRKEKLHMQCASVYVDCIVKETYLSVWIASSRKPKKMLSWGCELGHYDPCQWRQPAQTKRLHVQWRLQLLMTSPLPVSNCDFPVAKCDFEVQIGVCVCLLEVRFETKSDWKCVLKQNRIGSAFWSDCNCTSNSSDARFVHGVPTKMTS